MSTAILTPTSKTQYRLPEPDRQRLLSSIPPKIEYSGDVIPASLLLQSCKLVPSLPPNADIPVHEFERLMTFESVWKRGVFQENNGYLL